MKECIYTLANDPVFDELVAWMNSVRRNVSEDIPICIIPYDEKMNLVEEEIKRRKNVFIFKDKDLLNYLDKFLNDVWSHHPIVKNIRRQWYGGHVIRKIACFFGEFDRFVFYDVDTLAMKPINKVFSKLNKYDLVFSDWVSSKEINSHLPMKIELISKSKGIKEEYIKKKLHGFEFFGSKKGVFNKRTINNLKNRLIKKNELEWLSTKEPWGGSIIFNYMTFQENKSIFNFILSKNKKDRDGNYAKEEFDRIDNVLYNKGGLTPIYYIHYIGYPPVMFTRLCKGEEANIPYKDIFLFYRFMNEPEKAPKFFRKPSLIIKFIRFNKKVLKRLRLILS